MQTLTESQVRLFASARSWIEDEAVRQLYTNLAVVLVLWALLTRRR